MCPKFNESILRRDRKGKMENVGEDHVKMEAGIRIMLPKAKKRPGPPEDGRSKEGSSFRAFVKTTEENNACPNRIYPKTRKP